MELTAEFKTNLASLLQTCRNDWPLFARRILGVYLDKEQEEILRSVQTNSRTSVASGTARGKDFVAAVAAMCFLYTTPTFKNGKLVGNTKVALSAPTDRQVRDIMMPEISRLHRKMSENGFGFLAGKLNSYAIRTEYEEWFLVGFKADEHNHEAWSGFHAVNTMFVITEASGIADPVYGAIEGNLQGNSRLLLVFNYNITTGYAAQSQKSLRFSRFRLNSLNAPNVLQKKIVIPGQVDYEWVADKVQAWCSLIAEADILEAEGDFQWEGNYYRPNDLFRVKVLGLPPKVSSDVLVPQYWIDLAVERWKKGQKNGRDSLRLGVDVAGMGRDSSCFCPRYGAYVEPFRLIQSGGVANHMEIAGITKNIITSNTLPVERRYAKAFIDTIGEGAGVFSRLVEQVGGPFFSESQILSVKFSETAKDAAGTPLKDITGQYEFKNIRAYSYWAVRDWLNPDNKTGAMLPPNADYRGLTELKWNFRSDGSIELEKKEDLRDRIKHSPDEEDSLALTFYPSDAETDFDYSRLNALF